MGKRFRDLLYKIHNESPEQQEHLLENAIESWMGNQYSQTDDMLVIGVHL